MTLHKIQIITFSHSLLYKSYKNRITNNLFISNKVIVRIYLIERLVPAGDILRQIKANVRTKIPTKVKTFQFYKRFYVTFNLMVSGRSNSISYSDVFVIPYYYWIFLQVNLILLMEHFGLMEQFLMHHKNLGFLRPLFVKTSYSVQIMIRKDTQKSYVYAH